MKAFTAARFSYASAFALSALVGACSESSPGGYQGHPQGGATSGGANSGGLNVALGGSPSSGGSSVSGGAASLGGANTSGGALATGGAGGTGGVSGSTGGSANAGFGAGGSASGGSASGGSASGGSASGGSASGGTASGGTASGSGGGSGAGSGGAKASGGAGGSSGGATSSSGGKASTGGATSCTSIVSTATRPQLQASAAAMYTIQNYLAKAGPTTNLVTDNWDPTAGLSAASLTADFTVAKDGSGTHDTVQAAINSATGTARRNILLKPGTYREIVSVPNSAAPITLYGADADATKVVIVSSRSADAAGGTGASAILTSKANGFQLLNLTVSNDFATPEEGDGIQAVAFYSTGDKAVLHNVRLHGFQDTLYLDTPNATTVARVYVKNSFIEGDMDFIFGRATVVFQGSTIHYLSSRRKTNSGVHFAPSTHVDNPLGFLVIGCTFTAEASAPANKISLGRSWDTSSVTPTPNGQAVIRESVMGAHINRAAPWEKAATSGRAYSATGNRFNEYCNSGPGSGG